MGRRVVITGLGLINACGSDAATAWKSCVEGRSGVTRITRFDAAGMEFPCLVAGEVKGFVPEQWVEAKEVKKLDLSTLYGLAAADMAWKDSGIATGQYDPDRVRARSSAPASAASTRSRTRTRRSWRRGPRG